MCFCLKEKYLIKLYLCVSCKIMILFPKKSHLKISSNPIKTWNIPLLLIKKEDQAQSWNQATCHDLKYLDPVSTTANLSWWELAGVCRVPRTGLTCKPCEALSVKSWIPFLNVLPGFVSSVNSISEHSKGISEYKHSKVFLTWMSLQSKYVSLQEELLFGCLWCYLENH